MTTQDGDNDHNILTRIDPSPRTRMHREFHRNGKLGGNLSSDGSQGTFIVQKNKGKSVKCPLSIKCAYFLL